MTVTTDPALGGRWTSLRAAGRDWLWHRPDPGRRQVRPGDSLWTPVGLEKLGPDDGTATGTILAGRGPRHR